MVDEPLKIFFADSQSLRSSFTFSTKRNCRAKLYLKRRVTNLLIALHLLAIDDLCLASHFTDFP